MYINGMAQWVFIGSQLHAELLEAGWRESRSFRYTQGAWAVMMVKVYQTPLQTNTRERADA